jgi:hypothetical protein
LEVVRRHKITIQRPSLQVRLRQASGHELAIEEDSTTRQARVALYLPTDDGPKPKLAMEVLAHINSRGEWWPYELFYEAEGRRTVAQPQPSIDALIVMDLEGQWQLAGLADLWAGVLVAGFWFDPSVTQVVKPEAKAPRARRSKWPQPTMEEPDWATLEEWMLDSVCEATDGCPIEPDVAPWNGIAN